MPTSFEEFKAALKRRADEGESESESSSPSPSQARLARGEQLVTSGMTTEEAPNFAEKLGSEFTGGAADLAGGVATLMSDPLSLAGAGGAAEMGLGAARMIGAVPTAIGAQLGKTTLDATGNEYAAGVADAVGQTMGVTGVAGAVKGAAKSLRLLPGASTAFYDEGLQTARGIAGKYLPNISSDKLYAVVDAMNPTVTSLPNLKRVAEEIVQKEKGISKISGKLADSRLQETAADIVGALSSKPIVTTAGVTTGKQAFEFNQIRDVIRRLGQRIDELRDPMRKSTGSSEELGATKRMLAAIYDDLEKSADKGVGDAADALKAANVVARREFAVKELSEVVENGIKHVQGGQLAETPNFGTMLNNLRKEVKKNELFAKSFSAKEMGEIEKTLGELAEMPVIKGAKGRPEGSSLQWKQGGAGMVAGAAVGNYLGVGTGTGAAVGAGLSVVAANAISSLLSTQGGRKFLISVARNEPRLFTTTAGLGLLQAAARAGVAAGETE